MINILFDDEQNLHLSIKVISKIDKNEITLLLKNGANANGIIYTGIFESQPCGSYLQYSLAHGRLDIAKILLKFNAKVEKVENSIFNHPIFYIIKHKGTDVKFLKFIISKTDRKTIISLLKSYNSNQMYFNILVDTLIEMKLEYDYLEYFI